MVHVVANKAEFESKMKDAGSKLVIVDFFAEWCRPCKMIAPKLEAMSTGEFKDCVFLKVNVDECDELAQQFHVSAMPTFKFFKNGAEVAEVVGANEAKIRDAIKANM